MASFVFYNAFILALVSLACLLISIDFLKRGRKSNELLLLAWFWLTGGLAWGAWSLAHFFNTPYAHDVAFYARHAFAGLHIIWGVYYLIYVIFNKKILYRATVLIWICLFIFFLFIIFKDGYTEVETTTLGLLPILPPLTFYMILAMVILPYLAGVYYVVNNLIHWQSPKRKPHYPRVFGVLSILIYTPVALIDELGIIMSWHHLFIHLVTLSAVLMSYLAYTGRSGKYKIEKI